MRGARGSVLVLNAGSSSLKFQLFGLGEAGLTVELRGQVDGLGGGAPRFAAGSADGALAERHALDPEVADSTRAVQWLWGWLQPHLDDGRLLAAGHRVVHGGAAHAAPVRVDDALLERLQALVPLAPLHQPHNLEPIRALAARRPELPQVACFDTAFHRTQPLEAELFALPRAFHAQGVRRYGFHGLSYEWIARRLPEVSPRAAAGRTVVAHLGSGVSMCAMLGGRSVATTMGFTALDGCPMGTRTGSLDPGVVLWLQRERAMSLDAVESLLYRESGLLGLSGVSADMRVLLASAEPAAREAIDYFTYRLAREVGSLAAALGGLDALVFTAGIGEHSPEIRAEVMRRCAWLGLRPDEAANAAGGPCLTAPGSPVHAWRIETDEERLIAERTVEVLGLA